MGQAPFAPCAKKVLELTLSEAVQIRHSYIGTEHILLELMRKPKGAATRVVSKLGVDLDGVRQEVVRALGAGRARRVLETRVRGDMGRVVASRTIKKAFRARVEGLVIRARCGVTDEERAAPQPLRLDLDYLYEAGERDDLYASVDYGRAVECIAELLEKGGFRLLETGARMVGEHVLGEFPPFREVTLRVTKLRVPVDREVSGISVEAGFVR